MPWASAKGLTFLSSSCFCCEEDILSAFSMFRVMKCWPSIRAEKELEFQLVLWALAALIFWLPGATSCSPYLMFLLALFFPTMTNINFLPTISIQCQEIRLWELIKWSPKRKCFDLLLNSLKSFFREIYRDPFGEFVSEYWGLKGQRMICLDTPMPIGQVSFSDFCVLHPWHIKIPKQAK